MPRKIARSVARGSVSWAITAVFCQIGAEIMRGGQRAKVAMVN